MDALLAIRGLVKRYPTFTLEGIDLLVEPNTVVGLVGSNGAGKTTTIKASLGLISCDSGSIELFGKEIAGHDRASDNLLADLKEKVGVVFDSSSFPGEFRVRDIARLGSIAYRTWDSARFAALVERFHLSMTQKIKTFSRGMGMKLSLAYALSHHAQLLLLDEATAGLDPLAREEVLDLLRDFMLGENCGILLSTHITSDLDRFADRVACIDGGHIVFDLPKEAITDEAGIAHCRHDDLEAIRNSGAYVNGEALMISQGSSVDVLVPDRQAFQRAFPRVACERASIEDYMALRLKGEHLEGPLKGERL